MYQSSPLYTDERDQRLNTVFWALTIHLKIPQERCYITQRQGETPSETVECFQIWELLICDTV